jgi:hypothetical protein
MAPGCSGAPNLHGTRAKVARTGIWRGKRQTFFDISLPFTPQKPPAAREARRCMSDNPGPTPSLQDARFRHRRIGKAMSQLYAGLTSEELQEDLLSLLAEADLMLQARSMPSQSALRQMTQPSSHSWSL